MPIEIRELVIRATIADETQHGVAQQGPVEHKKEIIAECVDQVLEILKRKEER